MVTAASSFRNQDACARMAMQVNTASTENAGTIVAIQTGFVIMRQESACAILSILLTIEEYHGIFGRAMIAAFHQHSVDKKPTLFGHHWL